MSRRRHKAGSQAFVRPLPRIAPDVIANEPDTDPHL